MIKSKKIVNFRLFTIIAVSLVLATYFSVSVLKPMILKWCFLISCVIGLGVSIFLMLKYKNKKMLVAIISISLIIFSSVNLILRQNYMNSYKDFDDENVLIYGRIASDYSYTDSGNIKIIIDELNVTSGKRSAKINGELSVYINPTKLNLLEVKHGREIEINAQINLYTLNSLSDISGISNGIIGYVYCTADNVKIYDKLFVRLDEKIRNFVYDKLKDLGVVYSDIAYAMFFGKTAFIESDINGIFKMSGTTHILAVSGMHITIIIAIIHFIFKKLKIKTKYEMILLLLVLPFYNYLCDYSVSVVRASIMGVIALWASMRKRAYDGLSSLSITAVIILIFNPLKLYNYSFILSFSTILAFILLYPMIKSVFDKIFYNKCSSAISMCLCTQIGLAFVQLYLFGEISLLSFISNLIIIPLTTIAFEFLLLIFPLILLISPLAFLTKIFDFLILTSLQFGNYIVSLGLFFTNCYVISLVPFLFFGFLFVISDYLFISKKKKSILASILLGCCIVLILSFNVILS